MSVDEMVWFLESEFGEDYLASKAIVIKLRAADALAEAIQFVDREMGLVPGTILGFLTAYESAGQTPTDQESA